jgi:hypothetical protein
MRSPGGANTCRCLLHVAFCRGCGVREVPSNGVCSEAWPCGKLVVVDGFDPSRWWWAEGTLVKELDKFSL